jgi:hypothetical protein
VIPGPHGKAGHHAKLWCRSCERTVRWLPKPGPTPPPDEVFLRAAAGAPAAGEALPALVGTVAQVEWAAKVRALLLRRIENELGHPPWLAARGIVTAGWWISNKDRRGDQIRWPESWSKPVANDGFKVGSN